jgi:hypothetical protein
VLLLFSVGGPRINVFKKKPGSGSTIWDAAFGVYGGAGALYDGSIGVATQTGLYEVSLEGFRVSGPFLNTAHIGPGRTLPAGVQAHGLPWQRPLGAPSLSRQGSPSPSSK